MQEQRDSWAQKAKLHYKNKEYEQAVSCCNEALKQDYTDYVMFQLRGIAYQSLGNYGAAVSDLTRASQLDPANAFTKDLLKKAIELKDNISKPLTAEEERQQVELQKKRQEQLAQQEQQREQERQRQLEQQKAQLAQQEQQLEQERQRQLDQQREQERARQLAQQKAQLAQQEQQREQERQRQLEQQRKQDLLREQERQRQLAAEQEAKKQKLKSLEDNVKIFAQKKQWEELDSSFLEIANLFSNDYANGFAHKCSANMDIQKYAEALANLYEIIKLDINFPGVKEYFNFVKNKLIEEGDACKGKLEDALSCYKVVLSMNPDDTTTSLFWTSEPNEPAAQLGRAHICSLMGEFPEALAIYERLIATNAENKKAWIGKGDVCRAERKYDEAILFYDVYCDPNNAVDCSRIGVTLFCSGKFVEALEFFKKALLINPDEVFALQGKALCLLQQRKTEEALFFLKKADEFLKAGISTANKVELLCCRGDMYLFIMHYADAYKAFEQVQVLNPENKYARSRLRSSYEFYHYLMDFGLLPNDSALIHIIKSINVTLTAVNAVFTKIASMQPVMKPVTQAQLAEESISKDEKINQTRLKDANAFLEMGFFEQALACLQSNEKSDFFEKARILSLKGDYLQALAIYDQLIAEDINDKKALVLKGKNLLKLSRFEEAMTCFAGANGQVHGADLYYNGLVFLLRDRDANRAENYFGQVLKLFPKNLLACQGMAFCRLLNGDQVGAERLFKEIDYLVSLDIETSAVLLEIYSNRGELYFVLGYFDAAKLAYERAYPHAAEVKEGLARVLAAMDSLPSFLQKRDSMIIPRETVFSMQKIGQGSFGEVHKGEWTYKDSLKTPVAIKQLRKDVVLSQSAVVDFKKEVEIHSKLNFYAVVKVYGIALEESDKPYCMIMEYMELGSLRDVLDVYKGKPESERLSWDVRLLIAKDMAMGIAYLHSQNPVIIHSDIKSLNVLLDGRYRAKVSDFGLAKLKTEMTSRSYVQNNASQPNKVKGSLMWMAPELFDLARRTIASDVFSLAVVFWELASYQLPYEAAQGNNDLIQSCVKRGVREKFDERTPDTSKEYIELVECCWEGEPKKRPSAEMVVVKLNAIYANCSLAPTLFSPVARVSSPRTAPKDSDYLVNTPASTQSNGSYMGNSSK